MAPVRHPIPSSFKQKHVLIWGAGLHGGGLAAARHCERDGATISILDRSPPSDLPQAAAYCQGRGWNWHLGQERHPVIAKVDYIIASPAIPPRVLARLPAGTAPVIGADAIFFNRHQGPRIAVTGTKGKSTTARLLSLLLDWPLAGNSHKPLLDILHEHGPRTPVVCELSSFQLWYLQADPPHFHTALLTALGVDHLDWHQDHDDYVRSKLALLDWSDHQIMTAALGSRLERASGLTVRCDDDRFLLDDDTTLAHRTALRLPGSHNGDNACLALTAALAQKLDPTMLAIRLAQMQALPHRLQQVHRQAGIAYVNDSTATTPQATMAALEAIDGPLSLILGGRGKGADFVDLAKACRKRGCHVVCLAGGPRDLLEALQQHDRQPAVVEDMRQAVQAAIAGLPTRQGTVLLSPACASAPPYRDYAERGGDFVRQALLADGPPTLPHPLAAVAS